MLSTYINIPSSPELSNTNNWELPFPIVPIVPIVGLLFIVIILVSSSHPQRRSPTLKEQVRHLERSWQLKSKQKNH